MISYMEHNPYYKKAIEFLKEGKLEGLSVGTHEIDGKYIDLQVPLSGDEYFGVKPRKECGEAKDINAGNDIMFFDDPVTETVHVKAGDSITFAPDTAHAPLIGTGRIKKAIFKIKVV